MEGKNKKGPQDPCREREAGVEVQGGATEAEEAHRAMEGSLNCSVWSMVLIFFSRKYSPPPTKYNG